jgi:hypothetical protein
VSGDPLHKADRKTISLANSPPINRGNNRDPINPGNSQEPANPVSSQVSLSPNNRPKAKGSSPDNLLAAKRTDRGSSRDNRVGNRDSLDSP